MSAIWQTCLQLPTYAVGDGIRLPIWFVLHVMRSAAQQGDEPFHWLRKGRCLPQSKLSREAACERSSELVAIAILSERTRQHYRIGAGVAQHKGIVAGFNNIRGIGTLTCECGTSVYCHYRAIKREEYLTLMPGEHVEFDIVQGKNGPEAENVVVLPDQTVA